MTVQYGKWISPQMYLPLHLYLQQVFWDKENKGALSVISQETSPDCPQQGFHQNNKTPDCSSHMENHMENISFKQSVLIKF